MDTPSIWKDYMIKEETMCFTGHRPQKLGGYDENNGLNIYIKENLKDRIEFAYGYGYRTFLTGMALGVDQWAGELVVEFKKTHPDVELHAVVPFKGQESRWPEESQNRYRRLLYHCDAVTYVSDPPYSAEKMQLRNEWMVNHSKLVCAVYDGSGGGTGNCVKYAKKQSVHIWTIDPNDYLNLQNLSKLL